MIIRSISLNFLFQLGIASIIPTAALVKDPGTMTPKLTEKIPVIVSHINDLTDFWVQYRATEKNIFRFVALP